MAHELRTPLGRMRMALEDALRETDAGRVRALVGRALDHGDDLSSLFASLLRIAEIERCGIADRCEPSDLEAVAAALFEAYAPAVEDGGRSLTLRTHGPAMATADRALVAQALANLLDNAQLHTPPGTNVTIEVDHADGRVRVTVLDDGDGVAEADRQRITERFVRIRRERPTPGHGLGLSMVAAVATACGGGLEIADAGPGLRVTLSLPSDATRGAAARIQPRSGDGGPASLPFGS
jgi:hypothetical protein